MQTSGSESPLRLSTSLTYEASEMPSFKAFPSISLDSLIHSRQKRPIRSQHTIALAILEACRTPTVQHWIMVKARLGYETFWHHMNALLSRGLMDAQSEGNRTFYKVSSKGLDFLNRHAIEDK